MPRMLRAVIWCAFAVVVVHPARSYSVLAHETIIDSAWEQNIRPLLVRRFPQAGPEDLLHAHAYAYGGSIIQDMGYYPFGSRTFSDLVHYVRSGDFVVNLIRDSQDLNEYAFALGALAHYAADNNGHPEGINPSVAIEYPKLAQKFGSKVTYEDNPSAHLKVEFGFDALEVARGRYAPQAYHDFIGFQVSKPLLKRAFLDTYSLELDEVFNSLDLAVGTYRFSVSKVIPEMTKVAWAVKGDELTRADPTLTRKKFIYHLPHGVFKKEWDHYEKPGLGARILAVVIRFIPKLGPWKAASFKTPNVQTERLFEASLVQTLALYRSLLARSANPDFTLENRDFDTGAPTRPTEYRLADDSYSNLAIRLSKKRPADVDPKVIANILAFYRNPGLPYATRKHAKKWRETLEALAKLRTVQADLAPVTGREALLPVY